MRPLVPLLLAAFLALLAPGTASAQQGCVDAPEAGIWTAPSGTRSWTRLIVTASCDGRRLEVQLWGSCRPRDCYQGRSVARITSAGGWNPGGFARMFHADGFRPGSGAAISLVLMRWDRPEYGDLDILHVKSSWRTPGRDPRSLNVDFRRLRDDVDVAALARLGSAGLPPHFEQSTDRWGGDLPGMPIVLDETACGADCGPAFCERMCARDSRCRSWTYGVPGVWGAAPRCWLKRGTPAPAAHRDTLSGVLPR